MKEEERRKNISKIKKQLVYVTIISIFPTFNNHMALILYYEKKIRFA